MFAKASVTPQHGSIQAAGAMRPLPWPSAGETAARAGSALSSMPVANARLARQTSWTHQKISSAGGGSMEDAYAADRDLDEGIRYASG